MNPKTFILVADKFSDFTTDKPALTLSQLTAMVKLPSHVLPDQIRLIPGQGLPDADLQAVVCSIEGCRIAESRWDISALKTVPQRADRALSHKQNPQNTLISSPVRKDEDTFLVDLTIDQNCAMMDDHQTGQHVPGMVLIEAARQAFLAVTEVFYLHSTSQKSCFVINTMSTEFLGFVFPVAAHIEYRVISKNINERRQRFSVAVDIVQGGKTRTTCQFSFTVYPDQVILRKETELAVEAAQAVLEGAKSHADRISTFQAA